MHTLSILPTRHTLTATGTRTHTLSGVSLNTQLAVLGCLSWSCVNRPAQARAVNPEPGLFTQIDGDSPTGGESGAIHPPWEVALCGACSLTS